MRKLSLKEKFELGIQFISGLKILKQFPFCSEEEIKSWQMQRLKNLVKHAYEKVPFYRKLYSSVSFEPGDLKNWKDFHGLPLVTKDDVINNYPHSILEEGVDQDELIVSRSSGSSGKVLDIAYNNEAMLTFILAGLRLYKMGLKYKPWHKQLYVYTSPYPLNSLFGLYPLIFIPTLAPVKEIVESMMKNRPDLLVCYPSILKQIAALMDKNKVAKIGLKAISVNSEMSVQAERDWLSDIFNCPVLDEYSSEELTRIAAQCVHGNYHIFEDINYIETLDNNLQTTDSIGIIIGTNLHNFVMPMIRYKQDDRGKIEKNTCSCGWRFRILTSFEGRKNDSFTLPSGKILSSGFLLDATYEFLLKYRTATKDFCLIQKDETKIILQIVPDKDWNHAVEKDITDRFKSFLEETVSFNIKIVQECEKTKSGKRNPIINMLNRAK